MTQSSSITSDCKSIVNESIVSESIVDYAKTTCSTNDLTLYKFNENMYFGSRSSPVIDRKCECGQIDCSYAKSSSSANQSMCSIDVCSSCDTKYEKKLQAQLVLERLSRFQVLQTYASVKYLLMISILISIADGLFILTYHQAFIRDLQFSLFRRRHRLMSEYSRFVFFDEQRLRVATGSLYLINVFIQLIGLFGVNGDRLLITSSYAIYSIACFLFTIGPYLPYRRLLISLCINCCLAILSTMFAIFIKKFKHIQFGHKPVSI